MNINMNNSKHFYGTIQFYETEGLVEWIKNKAKEVREFNDRRDREFAEIEETADDTPDVAWERMQSFWNKGSQKEEWEKWRNKFSIDRNKFWADGCIDSPDYHWAFFMMLQHFKLQWMIFYFENLGHLESNEERAGEMRFASRLLEIILCKGYDYDSDQLPYVNYANAHRFQYINTHGERFDNRRAEVRFRKAYCLYFEWLKTHLMTWVD